MTDAGVRVSAEPSATSLTLLEQIRNHDPRGWERFVELYGPLVYRWCRRAGLQEADVKDVGQEVFAAVTRAIGGYQHQCFRGWLRTITDRKVLDHVRRRAVGGDGVGGTDGQKGIEAVADPPRPDTA